MSVNHISGIFIILMAIAGLMTIFPCSATVDVSPGTPVSLAEGDPLIITGTGYMNGSAAIWEFGPGFFAYTSIPAAPDGSFTWTQGSDITGIFRSGPLMIVVQDPGSDRRYSVHANTSGETNRILAGNGTDLLEVEPGSLDIPTAMDCAKQVQEAISREGTDDSGTLRMVFVELPALLIRNDIPDGIPTVAAGQSIRFSGTMNLAAEDRITARIEDTAAIGKTGSHMPVRTGAVTTIRTGGLQNRWEYTLNTSGLGPGEYLATIGWERTGVSGQDATVFRVIRPPDTATGFSQPGSERTTGNPSFSRIPVQPVSAITLSP